MRKLIYLLFTLIPFQLMNGQIFEETFDTWPHENWTLYNEGTNTSYNWSVYDWYNAPSGDSVLMHDWSNDCDNWMVLPAINLTVNSVLSFYERNYNMYLYNYNGVMISTGSSDPADGDFVELYEASEPVDNFTLRRVSLADYTGQSVYIAFNIVSSYEQSWLIDDIKVDTAPQYNDLALVSIDQEEYVLGKKDSISLHVINEGGNTIASGTQVNMYVDDILVASRTLPSDLEYLEVDTLTYPLGLDYGIYELKFIKTVSDDSTSNDTIVTPLVITGETAYLEDFENDNPFEFSFKTNLNTYSYYWEEEAYEGDTYIDIENWDILRDTIFFNKYYISDSAMFSCFMEGDYDFVAELLYSDDGENWTPIDTFYIQDGSNYSQIAADLSALPYSEAYIAIALDMSYTYLYLKMDYLLLPPQITGTPPCDIISSEHNGEVTNRDFLLRWEAGLSDVPIISTRFYFGTDGGGVTPPTNMVNGSYWDGSYSQNELMYDTVYYYQIIPVGVSSEPTGCEIHSFRTPKEPFLRIDSLYEFNEENMPLGWIEDEGKLGTDTIITSNYSDWDIGSYNNINDSTNAFVMELWLSSQREWLISPKTIIGDTIHMDSLFFDLSLTNWYNSNPGTFDSDDTLAILVSENNIWKKENVIEYFTQANPIGYNNRVGLSLNEFKDTINIGFYAQSTAMSADNNIYIDNLIIKRTPENALLDSLFINDVLIEDFNPDSLSYSIYTEETTAIPVITAKAQDIKAKVVVTQATGLPGTATIEVTAQNSNFKNVYTVNIIGPGENALLEDILVNDTSIAGFNPNTKTYIVNKPVWAAVPTVTAVAQDSNAYVTITQATAVPGTAIIKVLAEDSITSETYTIRFTEKNNNSLLSVLSLDGDTIEDFDPNTISYDVAYPSGTPIPVVTAEAQDDSAHVTITQATEIPGSATVVVLAEDSLTSSTYTINFDYYPAVDEVNTCIFLMYPNPAEDIVTIKAQNIERIRIFDISGCVVMDIVKPGYDIVQLEVARFNAGMYIVEIQNNNGISQQRLILK